MDIYLIGALLMILTWAGIIVTTEAAGWTHLLLTFGLAILIWRIVARGTVRASTEKNDKPSR